MWSLDGLPRNPLYKRVVERIVRVPPDARERLSRMASVLRPIHSARQVEVFDRLGECGTVSSLAERVGMDRRDCLRILAKLEKKCRRIAKNLRETCHTPAP